jgi:hypothetical protein
MASRLKEKTKAVGASRRRRIAARASEPIAEELSLRDRRPTGSGRSWTAGPGWPEAGQGGWGWEVPRAMLCRRQPMAN